MPYVKIGYEAIHHGRKLLKLLCQLKNFGQGRIVYKAEEQVHKEPSFYRILLAQPEMDADFNKGRVVAERVFRGKRFLTPVNLSEELSKPDFRLVPKDEEATFCRWPEVQDYLVEKHAPLRSRYMEMPPLMRKVLLRSKLARGETVGPEDFLLPAFKIYEGELRLSEQVEPHSMEHHLREEFATHRNFDMASIPTEEWNTDRLSSQVGHKIWLTYVHGWEQRCQRLEELSEPTQKETDT